MNRILIFVLFALLYSCQPEVERSSIIPAQSETALASHATPIALGAEGAKVHLEDYFMETDGIDSISVAAPLQAQLSSDKKILDIKVEGDLPRLATLRIYIGVHAYDFLVKKSQKQKTKLSYKAAEGVKQVQVVGDINNWNPAGSPMKKEGNTWTVDLELNPGRYPYQIVVDGKWILDPANEEKISNGMGGFNSLLEVAKPAWNQLPKLSTKAQNGPRVTIATANQPTEIFAFWQNHLIPIEKGEGQIEISIPDQATAMSRSFLRLYSYNGIGLSNDLLVPLENGKVLTDVAGIKREDKEAMTMYFTLIDRFNNGNKENDQPLEDSRLKPIQNYMGGDLAGITEKIKSGYFKELGINTLWLSPLTQNPLKAYQEYPEPRRWYSGYHGYWPISSSKVDSRFGSDAELEELVTVAHDNGINVLLDFVCNHVHQEHPIYQQHPDWVTDLVLPDGSKNIRIWDEQRLTTWFDTFLPTLDLEKEAVVDIQSDSAIYWIKKFKLDGFRHDATKHVPVEFWRTLTRKLKEEVASKGQAVYQIGETFGSHELIASYLSTGLLDGQFDFNLYFNARDVFAKDEESFDRLAVALRESFDYYGYHSTMGNITGNHDLTRFMGLASGAVAFDEDAKEAGYARDIQVKDNKGYQKLSAMTAFLMTIPGIPVVYYGDEIGMVGGGDPDNRRPMRFEGLNELEQRTKSLASELGTLRRGSLSLLYGDFELLQADKETLIYARHYFDKTSVVVFSKEAGKKIKFSLPDYINATGLVARFGNKDLNVQGEVVNLTIGESGFEVLTNE